jgi:hypothetical protein
LCKKLRSEVAYFNLYSINVLALYTFIRKQTKNLLMTFVFCAFECILLSIIDKKKHFKRIDKKT